MRNDERAVRHITKCPSAPASKCLSTLLGRIHVLVVVETVAIAAPTHRADSGAEVLSLHLSDALVKANPNGRSATQSGAPRRCTSRAGRRALPPSKGAAPDLQRWQRRFDERQMHVRHDTSHAELDGRVCYLACGACALVCTAHSTLSTHGSCPCLVRPWLAAMRRQEGLGGLAV